MRWLGAGVMGVCVWSTFLWWSLHIHTLPPVQQGAVQRSSDGALCWQSGTQIVCGARKSRRRNPERNLSNKLGEKK